MTLLLAFAEVLLPHLVSRPGVKSVPPGRLGEALVYLSVQAVAPEPEVIQRRHPAQPQRKVPCETVVVQPQDLQLLESGEALRNGPSDRSPADGKVPQFR